MAKEDDEIISILDAQKNAECDLDHPRVQHNVVELAKKEEKT